MCANTARPEKVLVVDDEPAIRGLVLAVLTGRGYRVLAAESGAVALAHFAEHGHEVDLVATDITMPGMSGPEMVSRLLQVRADVPVLFMTGYNPDNVLPENFAKRFPILHKPFTSDELVAAVRACLDGRGT